jgi:BESS motif
MDEFDLTLTQVRNKIRIYRTTYAQELKKMESNKDSIYVPKLAWFQELHTAFHNGKVKSFVKTPKKKNVKVEKAESIEIEFQEESDEGENETQYEIKKMGKNEDSSEHHHIIIEPYDEEYEVEEEPAPTHNTSNSNLNNTTSSGMFGTHSNELFLKSLQSTFDKLPDDKNMRARIEVQKILFEIAYEK